MFPKKIAGLTTAVALALTAAGCAAAPTALTAPAASPSGDANLHPCGNVEAITAHLHVPMANWYPQAKPFDGRVAAAVSTAATGVQREVAGSSGPARTAIEGWATSLAAMGTAMHGRDKALVLTRATAAQKSLATVRTVCNFQDR
ncbi:MAG: hypothetical protein JWO79_790 [Actinomycetia bacterium]|nr:hypothetical protein [Actinomycetes bacterium]